MKADSEKIKSSGKKRKVVSSVDSPEVPSKKITSSRAVAATIIADSKEHIQETPIVVAKPINDPNAKRKPWKVSPQNDEGVACVEIKQRVVKGVLVSDYVLGKGRIPRLGSKVKINFIGMFPDGTIFDSNLKRKSPLVFRLGVGQVVRGIDIGMEHMAIGGSREIVIPPELGYVVMFLLLFFQRDDNEDHTTTTWRVFYTYTMTSF